MDSEGYWGPITSNYDWCEYNYQYTFYIAEFFNTLSSIPIVLAGLYGLINSIRYKYQYKFYINNITLMIVGIGSIAFHGTLLRNGQILDEVPMLWCSLSMLYVSFTFRYKSNLILIVMILYGIISTIIYFYVSFDIFVIAYILTVGSLIISTGFHLRKVKNMNILKYGIGAGLFYAGGFFCLWLPEQILCGNRIEMEHDSILTKLQFHAIFHITSSIGPYFFMVYAVMMNYTILKQDPVIEYHTSFQIPVVHIINDNNKVK